MAIVAYITLIGWIISYVNYRQSNEKSAFVQYHLTQSLGVMILSIILSVASGILVGILPSLATLFYIVSLLPLVLMLMGIITASNNAERPVPLIGKMVEGKFSL
ncbi:hypothetical protein FLA_2150 [Filimonas lacunae]|nr:hypothetical protein FLA_2150 [Filimonas lacunae]